MKIKYYLIKAIINDNSYQDDALVLSSNPKSRVPATLWSYHSRISKEFARSENIRITLTKLDSLK